MRRSMAHRRPLNLFALLCLGHLLRATERPSFSAFCQAFLSSTPVMALSVRHRLTTSMYPAMICWGISSSPVQKGCLPPSSARATSRASRWASDSTLHYVFLCSFHISSMHFASQKSACLHFEHLVLAAFPHHSHIPDLGVRVLTAELASAVTPDILSTLDTDRACSLPRL